MSRDRLYLILFSVYVGLLVFATIGEVFHVNWILDIFDLKKVF